MKELGHYGLFNKIYISRACYIVYTHNLLLNGRDVKEGGSKVKTIDVFRRDSTKDARLVRKLSKTCHFILSEARVSLSLSSLDMRAFAVLTLLGNLFNFLHPNLLTDTDSPHRDPCWHHS